MAKSLKKDRKLVSLQLHEIKWIAKTYHVPIKDVRKAVKQAKSSSRKKIYAILRDWNYSMDTSKDNA
jgi:4-hydroxy-L-threonine phosphate dehydrogenase PdxA